MPAETTSPFTDPTQRSTDDAKLVAEILGDDEAANMRAMLGDQPQAAQRTEVYGSLELSANEQAGVEEIESITTTPEKRRDEYYAWAEDNGLAKVWVDNNFSFKSNGTVEAGNLSIIRVSLKSFPPNLERIRGGLDIKTSLFLRNLEGFPKQVDGGIDLRDNKLEDVDGLPKLINDTLFLSNNPIVDLDGLSGSTVIKNIWLQKIGATSIPGDIDLGGRLFIDDNQKELIADARAKGYRIQVTNIGK